MTYYKITKCGHQFITEFRYGETGAWHPLVAWASIGPHVIRFNCKMDADLYLYSITGLDPFA